MDAGAIAGTEYTAFFRTKSMIKTAYTHLNHLIRGAALNQQSIIPNRQA
jgi:hypothetical protein